MSNICEVECSSMKNEEVHLFIPAFRFVAKSDSSSICINKKTPFVSLSLCVTKT